MDTRTRLDGTRQSGNRISGNRINGIALLAAIPCLAFAAQPAALLGTTAPQDAIWVEDIDITKLQQRRGTPRAGKSIRDLPITLGGVVYPRGIGTRSISEFVIDLKGAAVRFEAIAGLDDAVLGDEGSVTFEVWADDTLVVASGLMRPGDPPKHLVADVTDARILTLLVDDGADTSNGDEVAWAGALLHMKSGSSVRPEPFVSEPEAAPALAPARGDPAPVIHNPRVTGGTPGRPFLFRIPATGAGAMRFTATGLPQGLMLDPATGILSGALTRAGATRTRITATNSHGTTTRELTIIAGADALARTPPMGWNSWNVWGPAVDQQKVLDAARHLVASGLAAHGFEYVVIDDTWQGKRDANGRIAANEKFPDMRALADAVHALGLKLGIYSSPGPLTCEEFAGSLGHERLDAETYAQWGVDFLKHDWCSYDDVAPDRSLSELQKPYRVMRDALSRVSRDIVYSLCQYGYGEVWTWGEDVGGNLWRTSGDLLDLWSNLESVGFRQAGRERRVRPGHWNDTDMLVVGTLGWGPNLRATRLTPNEQITHLTLWAIQAAPLFIGADLSKLDPLTLALLTNDDVLDVNQDPMGKAGGRVWQQGRLEVWSRPLSDGTLAVGLFNRGLKPSSVTARWSDLGIAGRQPVRDLWQRKELDEYTDSFSARVPRHGAVFVRIGKPADRS